MRVKFKKLIAIILIATLALGTNRQVRAEGIGVSGESSSGYASGGQQTHEVWCDTAIFGYRIYLVPVTVLFGEEATSTNQELALGSEFESWAKYCTYYINKTRVSDGTIARLTSGDKMSFNGGNNEVDNLKILNFGAAGSSSSNFKNITEYNIYDYDSKSCKLINCITRSRVQSYKVQGIAHTSTYSDANESFLNNFEGLKFYTEANAGISERNWAVFDGNTTFFKDCLDVSNTNSAICQDMETNNFTYSELVESFIDYTISCYSGKYTSLTSKSAIASQCGSRSCYADDDLGLVIEPVFAIYNEDSAANGTMLFTATQYARYALNKSENYYDGHGIGYWYDKASGAEGLLNGRTSASYVYGRTTNTAVTKRGSLTAYNYMSTLRPYNESSINHNGLNEYGGIGIVYKAGASGTELSLSSYEEYHVGIDYDSSEISILSNSYTEDGNVYVDSVTSGGTLESVTKTGGFTVAKPDITGSLDTYMTKSANERVDETGPATRIEFDLIDEDADSGYIPIVLKFRDVNVTRLLSDLGISYETIVENKNVFKNKVTEYIKEGLIGNSDGITLINGVIDYKGYPNSVQKLVGFADSLINTLNNRVGSGITQVNDLFKVDDKYSTSDITNLTTLYSGDLVFQKNSNGSIKASGFMPITIATSLDAIEVKSFGSYLTYMRVGDESTLEFDECIRKVHTGPVDVTPYPSTSDSDMMKISEYFVFTYDNVNPDGTYIQTTKYNGTLQSNGLMNTIKSILDSYELTSSNRSAMLSQIADAIANQYGLDRTRVEFENLGKGVSASNYTFNVRSYKQNGVFTDVFGTNAIVIEYTGANGSDSVAESMKQYELNTLENFYSAVPDVETNVGEVSDIGFLSDSSNVKYTFLSRTGSPVYNNAPMIGGYMIETCLSSTGLSALNPIFTWSSTRTQQFSNKHDGTGSVSVQQYMYALSRANYDDERTLADYSIWNTNTYPSSDMYYGMTAKQILHKYGFDFGTVPINDKTNSVGSSETTVLSGEYGKQSIITVADAGWKVITNYTKYTLIQQPITSINAMTGEITYTTISTWDSGSPYTKTDYIDGIFRFRMADLDTGSITTGDSRAYRVTYNVSKYVPYVESTPTTGSTSEFNVVSESSSIDNSYLGSSAIARPENSSDTLLTTLTFSDKSNSILGIYPEVLMKYYIPSSSSTTLSSSSSTNWTDLGDEYEGYSDGYTGISSGDGKSQMNIEEHYVYTVGEKARYFNPTSVTTVEMLGTTLQASKLVENDVSGKLSSSAFSTSSKVKSLLSGLGVASNIPVILSGGNIVVSTDSKLKAEITSYIIDIASTGDGVISSTTGNEMDMKSTWSSLSTGSYNTENVHQEFVTNFLNTIKQDLNIVVNTNSDTIDKELVSDSSKSEESPCSLEAVYNIVIKQGVVSNKDDVIASIANDLMSESTNTYTLNEALTKANEIYDSLDIENMIVKQFESKNSEQNSSTDNWYDEACSTLVIRKYISTVKIGSVVSSDKLDISWGPETSGVGGTKANSLYSSGYKAGIKYTLSFTDNQLVLPSGNTVTISKPLVRSMIKGCEFVIPDATVNDSKY